MKPKLRAKARQLRTAGYSISEIAAKLLVAKSSVSLWVRDIRLTNVQKHRLSAKGVMFQSIEKRRLTRIKNENIRRQLIVEAARKTIPRITKKDLWLLGVILYWAEGGKTQRGLVRFSNSDPEMVKLMMAFFRRVCNVAEEKFRCYIHTYPNRNFRTTERHWSGITKIPLRQFFKTYIKRTKSGKHQRDTLPFGTLEIYVCSTELFLTISGWVAGIFESY